MDAYEALRSLRLFLFPGDITRSTSSDAPVDVSPRYSVEQDIIPFRSVRSPSLTPVRDVCPVARTPIQDIPKTGGRVRNVPSLPGDIGNLLYPYAGDTGDVSNQITGFSGVTPTLNRSIVPGGWVYSKSYFGRHPSRIRDCVSRSSTQLGCVLCCNSLRREPEDRCRRKCVKAFPTEESAPPGSSLPGGFTLPPMPPTSQQQIGMSGTGLVRRHVSSYPYHRSSHRETFGAVDCPPGEMLFSYWGFSRCGPIPGGGNVRGSGDAVQGGNVDVEVVGADPAKCRDKSVPWFYSYNQQKGECGVDVLKAGLIGLAVLLVVMK